VSFLANRVQGKGHAHQGNVDDQGPEAMALSADLLLPIDGLGPTEKRKGQQMEWKPPLGPGGAGQDRESKETGQLTQAGNWCQLSSPLDLIRTCADLGKCLARLYREAGPLAKRLAPEHCQLPASSVLSAHLPGLPSIPHAVCSSCWSLGYIWRPPADHTAYANLAYTLYPLFL
jgi:hypothetical protein